MVMQKIHRIPRTESFIGPDDGKRHSYPPRRPRSQEAQSREPRSTNRPIVATIALSAAIAGGLAYNANQSDTSVNRNTQADAATLTSFEEQANASIKEADFSTQALVLSEGTKIYTKSDLKSELSAVTTGVGVVERPNKVQLGEEGGYAYWYRFSMPTQEGEDPAIGWLPASIIDGQQVGFTPSIEGRRGDLRGEYDLEAQTFNVEGEQVAQLKVYKNVIAANTALAQDYVLPLPISVQD